MRKLGVFESISIDGYFKSTDGDVSWSHRAAQDAEFDKFIADNASSGGELLFGRTTYEMMASFWPTPAAAKQFPVVAKHMNEMPKWVASKTLRNPSWQNTRVLEGDLVTAVRKLKEQDGPSIAILGSGTIVAQLSSAGLIDQYQLVVVPIVLGAGTTAFDGTKTMELQLVTTRAFKNGNVALTYAKRS